jgi:hypothetical protein
MSVVKKYNYEKFSIVDIKAYLNSRGYETELVEKQNSIMLSIKGTEVYVDVPLIDVNGNILASIRFYNYPRTEHHESDQKLYNELKRKFAVKSGESPKSIKDSEKLDIKDYRKKGIWPFNKFF